MILYHGSNIIVEYPDLNHSRDRVDFGRAFYTMPIETQAKNWCERYKKLNTDAFVSKYEFDERLLVSLDVLEFEEYSEEWLDFVTKCRLRMDDTKYDIVIGGVANDKVFNTIELYFKKLIDKSVALERLKFEKPNIQYAFRTQRAVDSLAFKGYEKL